MYVSHQICPKCQQIYESEAWIKAEEKVVLLNISSWLKCSETFNIKPMLLEAGSVLPDIA